MSFHTVQMLLKWVLVVASLKSGYVSCDPVDSGSATCEGAQCTDGVASVTADPGAERRTILLENAAVTWGSTLPPMLDALNEISNTLKLRHPTGQGMDCSVLYAQGYNTSGVYRIGYHTYSVTPHEPFHAYCDMETDGGGWTVFQRRFDGSTEFYRGWDQYIEGFGHVDQEYWLGLEKINLLTSLARYELRIDLEDFSGNRAHALYNDFHMSDALDNYKLDLGEYSGTAGDALYTDKEFSTRDRDNDNSYNNNCAERWKGAWWYHDCHLSNLNGLYMGDPQNNNAGMVWQRWRDAQVLKGSEMKIRRKA